MKPIGLYLHVPFCLSKCPYCDFYSLPPTPDRQEAYLVAMEQAMDRWAETLAARNEKPVQADTLYIGGGTPSLLGGKGLTRLIGAAVRRFGLNPDRAEITLEANPADHLADTLAAFAAAGGNRLSLGMQSADPIELALLGRRHTPADVERTVAEARQAGIGNLSLDLMLGLPGQATASVRQSVEVCRQMGASHVSAYLLKLEPGTPFFARQSTLDLPDEDASAALYLEAAQALEQAGYQQYEISNFARPGYESRHNTKYWDLQPYLGIGPAAHSFLFGQRFGYPRDLAAFLAGGEPEPEQSREDTAVIPEGGPEEYLMLRMRLTAGVSEEAFRARFGRPIPSAWRRRAASLPPSLMVCEPQGMRLTREGFLVSNAILGRLLADG